MTAFLILFCVFLICILGFWLTRKEENQAIEAELLRVLEIKAQIEYYESLQESDIQWLKRQGTDVYKTILELKKELITGRVRRQS